MPTATDISTAISTLGYPIVLSLVLIVGYKYMFDKFMERNEQMSEQHKAEMDAITTALNNNTVVLQKLCDRLDMTTEE